MSAQVILFLAACPRGSQPLDLGPECAEIQREIKMAPYRDDFRFESRWAVGIDELMRHLNELDPTVIHFSGHGGGSAGLMLADEQGQPQLVPADALTEMIGSAAPSARMVVLNACYTTEQAEVLRSCVDCVVGMNGAIGDHAARAFAIRFYGALGNRRSIGNAMAQGIAALAARQLSDEVLPRCLTRDGVEACEVFLGPRPAEPAVIVAPGPDIAERARTLLREIHVWLLAGYAADAILRAADVVELALGVLSGTQPETGALGALIDGLRRGGRPELAADATWLYGVRMAVEPHAHQIRTEHDADARRAAAIAARLAFVAGLVTASQAAESERDAAWRASARPPSALFRLDRTTHRKALEDRLEEPPRVLVVLVHGEVGQGHDHFAEIMTRELRSKTKGRWLEVLVKWPAPMSSLGTRFATLLDALARDLGISLGMPAGDPSTADGAQAWQPAFDRIIAALDARREPVHLRHVVHWLGSGSSGDDALVAAYVHAIWQIVARNAGEQVVVSLDLRRIERARWPLTRAWRQARRDLATARAIERILDAHHLPHGVCLALPELTSVSVGDLADWLHALGGRDRNAARLEAGQLVASTRGGRFDLVVQRLTALHLDCHRNSR